MRRAGHAIVVQCGGPTAVVNASLAAIIRAWPRHSRARLFGACWGFRGLASGDWVDLTGFRHTQRLRMQAGGALGSARDRLAEDHVVPLLRRLSSERVGLLFVIGGNGSLTAAHRLGQAAEEEGLELQVVGIPKTIDNDVHDTDVAPGYGSAAQFVARAVHDAALDLHSMRGFDDVAVIEVMGRHTGWLAAAASLAHWEAEPAPALILVPERPLDEDAFVAAVRERHRTGGVCLVVAAEGVRDGEGRFLAEKDRAVERDGSGQKLLALAGGPAPYLARLVKERVGLRCRQSRPDTILRSSAALASVLDRDLAGRVGREAVTLASLGHHGVMVALRRQGARWRTEPVPLDRVARAERPLPPRYLVGGFEVDRSFAEEMRCFLDGWLPGAVLFTHAPPTRPRARDRRSSR